MIMDIGRERRGVGLGFGAGSGVVSAMQIMEGPTSVDCQKDVRCWKSWRSVMELLIPCCGCQSMHSGSSNSNDFSDEVSSVSTTTTTTTTTSTTTSSSSSFSSSTVTGTIFGHRKGRVSFCIQEDPSRAPLLLIELGIPTLLLAREMQHGLLRIALECHKQEEGMLPGEHLLCVPLWTMYCNGRKVGYARRRIPSDKDWGILKTMKSVFVGAGVLRRKSHNSNSSSNSNGVGVGVGGGAVGDGAVVDELLYMRATYKRVCGSSDSESFHLINPDGSTRQELSIFFLRS